MIILPKYEIFSSVVIFTLISLLWKPCISEGVIWRCCNSSDSAGRSDIVLSSKFFIVQNNSSESNETTTVSECHNDESELSATISLYPNKSDTGFLPEGILQYGAESYFPKQYCVKEASDSAVTVKLVSNQQHCDDEGKHCLRKCCGALEVYDLSTYGLSKLRCVPSLDNPWSPVVYQNQPTGDPSSGVTNTSVQFVSDHIRNWCTDDVFLWSMRAIKNDRKSLFKILSNGSVIMKDRAAWKAKNTSRICIDGAINIPGYFDPSNKQTKFSGDVLDTIMLECGPSLAREKNSPLILYGAALFISTLFLLATMIVYGLLWDKQNIHGWTLLGYVTTEFLFYLSLIATFFYLNQYPDPDFTTEAELFSSFCGIIAVTSHFLYISSTCWLTVISFDIFSKFRILKLTRGRSKNSLKFLIYLLFTLIIPSIIVCTGVLLDLSYGDDLEVNVILPRYGWNKCFLDLRNAGFPYLFGPIGLLLGLNCLLYIATMFSLYKLQESTKFASANNTKVQKQRAKIRLFTKLFLLMGISWIFELVSYMAFGEEANIPVIIGDMINILQPILIFIIFVCKKDILQSLCQKYTTIGKLFASFEVDEVIASTASSSSRGPMLSRIWNPVSTTKWFRSRINSTMTDTSNISNQSIKSVLNGIDEEPAPQSETTAGQSTEKF